MVEATVTDGEAVHVTVTSVNLVRVGGSLRALRIRRRLRQQDLADRAGVGRGDVSAIELGRGADVPLAVFDRVTSALVARLDVGVRWNGERLDRLMDEAHAATVAAAVARLKRHGWSVAIEATFSIWGERGSIDVLGWHPPTQTVLVIEVKSVLPDIQSLLHNLDRKTRLAAEIAGGHGWNPIAVGRLVVIAESPTSRGRVRRHASVLDAALPARGAVVRQWLRAPSGGLAGILFLSNAGPGGSTGPMWRRERVRTRSWPSAGVHGDGVRPQRGIEQLLSPGRSATG